MKFNTAVVYELSTSSELNDSNYSVMLSISFNFEIRLKKDL